MGWLVERKRENQRDQGRVTANNRKKETKERKGGGKKERGRERKERKREDERKRAERGESVPN